MNNSKKNFGITGQSTTDVKKPHKHDANLQKNSTLYFQIGLILCLLATYALFEMQFQDRKITLQSTDANEIAIIDVAPLYQIEQTKKEKPKPKIDRSTEVKDKIEVVDDDKNIVEKDIFTPNELPDNTAPAAVDDIVDNENPMDIPEIHVYDAVEKVPVFPGCEKYEENNSALKKCMSKKISKLVNRKFNTDLSNEYGLTGKLKINTQFTIDRYGNVTDVKTRGSHPKLEEEAERVINKIPKMKPGYQQNKPVGVIYTLPITLYADN